MVKTSPSNAGCVGSIPGRGAKIPHSSQPKHQNIKQKQYCNEVSKDFKNGPHPERLSYRVKLSQKEKNKHRILTHIYGSKKKKKDGAEEPMGRTGIKTQT